MPSESDQRFQSYEIERDPQRFVGKTVTMAGKDGGLWEKVTIVAYAPDDHGGPFREFHVEGGSWIRDTFAEEIVREPLTSETSRVYPFDIARGIIHEVPDAE